MNRQKFARRRLLKGAVIAAASPWIVRSSALGGDGKPAASERITVAHVGVGNRGRALVTATRQVPQAQSVAVADCYRDRRESFAAVLKAQAYADFRQILDRSDIDAVVVATPDHWHVPIANMAVRAGKHIYVEKPLGLSLEQDLACQALVREKGIVFQYGTQQRSMPHCYRGCELVRRGAIGKLMAIEVDAPNGGSGGSTQEAPVPEKLDYPMWLGPAPEKPYTVDRCKPQGTYWIYDQSIGYLGGWGAHPLDIMVWGSDADLSGPVTIEATGVVPTEGLYDTVYNWDVKAMLGDVELRFRAGAERTRFIGESGWIQVARAIERNEASDPELLKSPIDAARPRLKRVAHHMGNFIEAVAAGDPSATVTSIGDAVRSDLISHLCDIAVRSGEKITWDPQSQKMIGASAKAEGMVGRKMRAPWTL